MAIHAKTPTTLNETYDLVTITMSQVNDGCLNEEDPPPLDSEGRPIDPPTRMILGWTKYRVDQEGISRRSRRVTDRGQVEVPNLYEVCAANPKFAAAMGAAQAAIVEYLTEQGIL